MNHKTTLFFLLLLYASLRSNVFAASWYDQKLEGWYYFEDQEKPKETSPITIESAEEILEVEKRKLKKFLALALLDPSTENVETYIQAQGRLINQSAKFADTWGKVLLNKPLLGNFLQNPTTSYGILAKRESDLRQRKTLIQELSKDCFLLLFFKGKDPLSEKAAEVALLFGRMNNWKIRAVSLDGEGLQNLSHFEIDKGLSAHLAVQAAPSFYAIYPSENKVYPVGAGLISVSDLEQNIELQFTQEPQ